MSFDEDIERWLRRGYFEDRRSQTLLRARSAAGSHRTVVDDQIERMLGSQVAGLDAADERGEIPPFLPAAGLGLGLPLGVDHRGNRVSIELKTLASGLLVLGATCAGKSVLLLNLLSGLADRGATFWAVDLYKSSLRQLIKQVPGLVVLTAQTLLVNPLKPASGRINVHVTADALSRALGLGERSRTLIAAGLDDLYLAFGNHAGNSSAYPVLHDLYEWIRRRNDLNAQARFSILDRLAAVLPSIPPVRRGWSAHDLGKTSIIFEVHTSETVRQLLLLPLLFGRLHDRLSETASQLEHLVVFDDAWQMLAGEDSRGNVAALSELASVTRSTGTGIALLVQTHEHLPESIIPNLTLKIMGRCGSAADYQKLGRHMGQTPEQIRWSQLNLQPGTFVAQVASGASPHPFVLRTPLFELPQASDRAVAESLRHLDHLQIVMADEYREWRPEHHVAEFRARTQASEPERTTPTNDRPPGPQATSQPRTRSAISKDELDLLAHIATQPFEGIAARYKVLGFSASKGNRLKASLIAQKLVAPETVKPPGRGRPLVLFDLTKKGTDLLENHGVRPAKGLGRGGVVHRYWAHLIVPLLNELGVRSKIEGESLGVRVDIDCETAAGVRCAIEIERGNRHITTVRRDLDAGYEVVACFVTDAESVETVKAEFRENSRVHVGLLRDFESVLRRALAARTGQE